MINPEALTPVSGPPLARLSTGSEAFDLLLGGGIPVRSVTVIAGEPGAGKTLFSLQMLFALARQGKKALYFTTLSEPAVKLIGYMQQFAFFDPAMVGSKIVFSDLGSVIRDKGAEETCAELMRRVEIEEPDVIIIDSFKALREILGDAQTARTLVYDLAVQTAAWGATTFFIGEYTETEIANESEFAIADGIIRFGSRHRELSSIREVQVLKMRGANYVSGRHFFEISSAGLEFVPRVRGPETLATVGTALKGRAGTGSKVLDQMLDGGLPRCSSTVIQGGTGTGKTLLALQFLIEGARRGEPGVHFSLEESPEQLRDIAQGFGWDLAPLEAQGLIHLSYCSPVELSTDAFLNRARQKVEQLKAPRAVLDSLTSMELGVSSLHRYRELVYALTKHFRTLGVTLMMNLEVPELLGAGELSGHGISFAASNVIQLKYLEIDARLERGISILKARGVRHDIGVHRLNFEPTGVVVGPAYEGMRGVRTGLPLPANVSRPASDSEAPALPAAGATRTGMAT